jgi:hypothetical protein
MARYTAAVSDLLILPAVASLTRGTSHLLRQRGDRVPSPVPVQLLIDTGSKRTTLIPGIIRHVDPPGGADVRAVTPTAAVGASLFWVRLDFPQAGLAPIEHVQVARLPMPSDLARFHGLLGRDLLQRLASFDWEGQRGRYTLRDTPGLLGWLRRWL